MTDNQIAWVGAVAFVCNYVLQAIIIVTTR
jgi:hypothetical protein